MSDDFANPTQRIARALWDRKPSPVSDEEYEHNLYGNRVGVFGKMLGGLGLDASGERKAQPWSKAIMSTLDAPAGLASSIGQAVTAPARAYRGEIPEDQMIPEGLNFAGSVALGSAAVPRPRGSVGMGSMREVKKDTAPGVRLAYGEETPDTFMSPKSYRDMPHNKDIMEGLKREYGVTEDPRAAGYMAPNGSLVDFSWGSGIRGEDHRAANAFVPDAYRADASSWGARGTDMDTFMAGARALRWQPESPGFEANMMPTNEQLMAAARYARKDFGDGPFMVDVSDPKTGSVVRSEEFRRPTYDQLREFFSGLAEDGVNLYSNPKESALPGTLLSSASHLDMSPEARMARAREMGFDTDQVLYHGTGKDFTEFSPGSHGNGYRRSIYLTDNPEIADIYANSKNYGLRGGGDPAIYPVFAKAEKPLVVSDKGPDGSFGWVSDNLATALGVDHPPAGKYASLYDEARRQGYDQVQIREMTDLGGPQTQYIPLEPNYIRSVNAAFDPAKSSSANLLAANPETSSAPGLGLMAEDQDTMRRRRGLTAPPN